MLMTPSLLIGMSTYQLSSVGATVLMSACPACLCQQLKCRAEVYSPPSQGVLAQYYSLPWLSFRDATWRSMRQNVSGFSMDDIMAMPRNDHHPNDRGHLCVLLSATLAFRLNRQLASLGGLLCRRFVWSGARIGVGGKGGQEYV